jgi:hypothetical protein
LFRGIRAEFRSNQANFTPEVKYYQLSARGKNFTFDFWSDELPPAQTVSKFTGVAVWQRKTTGQS